MSRLSTSQRFLPFPAGRRRSNSTGVELAAPEGFTDSEGKCNISTHAFITGQSVRPICRTVPESEERHVVPLETVWTCKIWSQRICEFLRKSFPPEFV